MMLFAVALLGVGFAAGVLLTALVALYVYGLLHAEAVRAVESYGGAMLFKSISPIRPPQAGSPQ
jgi:hypothetical protein